MEMGFTHIIPYIYIYIYIHVYIYIYISIYTLCGWDALFGFTRVVVSRKGLGVAIEVSFTGCAATGASCTQTSGQMPQNNLQSEVASNQLRMWICLTISPC